MKENSKLETLGRVFRREGLIFIIWWLSPYIWVLIFHDQKKAIEFLKWSYLIYYFYITLRLIYWAFKRVRLKAGSWKELRSSKRVWPLTILGLIMITISIIALAFLFFWAISEAIHDTSGGVALFLSVVYGLVFSIILVLGLLIYAAGIVKKC